MIQKITNLTSGKSITMETRFVRLPSTYNNVKYMTKVTSNDVMFVKLTFNNLQSYD